MATDARIMTKTTIDSDELWLVFPDRDQEQDATYRAICEAFLRTSELRVEACLNGVPVNAAGDCALRPPLGFTSQFDLTKD